MSGILQVKIEIEKLQEEYKIQSENHFKSEATKTTIAKEELVLEDCEA